MILDRALAGLGKAPGMRSPRMARNVLNFMQFYWKISQNCMLAPAPLPPRVASLRGILDPLPPGQRARVQHIDNIYQQECIPVGCVPSAAVAVSRGGVGGVTGPRGVYLAPGGSAPGGLYLVPGGVLALGGVCSRGCLLPGGVGVCSSGGYTWSGTPPPLWTDTRL